MLLGIDLCPINASLSCESVQFKTELLMLRQSGKVSPVLVFGLICLLVHLAVIPEKCDASPASPSQHIQQSSSG